MASSESAFLLLVSTVVVVVAVVELHQVRHTLDWLHLTYSLEHVIFLAMELEGFFEQVLVLLVPHV